MKFNTIQELEKYLLEKGYKKYKANLQKADFLMQKRLNTDNGGELYLDLYIYDFGEYKLPFNISVMPEIQILIDKKPINAINISGIIDNEFEIKEIEHYFTKIFDILNMEQNK
jgi:hypothetical protein